jgi:hypothetical protein
MSDDYDDPMMLSMTTMNDDDYDVEDDYYIWSDEKYMMSDEDVDMTTMR